MMVWNSMFSTFSNLTAENAKFAKKLFFVFYAFFVVRLPAFAAP